MPATIATAGFGRVIASEALACAISQEAVERDTTAPAYNTKEAHAVG
jgi:hypothetical protein